ncbi:MAG TPA: hypothetical protein PK228_14870 [Saprospiraceae bacterium]|nr:hypothetical protein [Saprospiraceae bacterium]
MSLQTADEREAFWEEVREKSRNFTDEQKALFVLSWSESIKESGDSIDKTIAEIDALLARHDTA